MAPDLPLETRACPGFARLMCRESSRPAVRTRSDVLKIGRGQLAALAHNVVGELLSLIEVAHSGALDCGNMDEHVLSAVGRLNEAEALLGIEKLDCTLCHIWPPVKNADRRP